MKFREWFIESVTPFTMQANIPIPNEVRVISKVLKAYDPNAEVYAVGGAVRDYLYNFFHGQGKPYKPKDVDVTTNLAEEEILTACGFERYLTPEQWAKRGPDPKVRPQTPQAQQLCQQYNVRVKEKESVDTFGVAFVVVGDSPVVEVAPFRKDIGSADGRRPERVERGTIYDDAMRRDFTINNLYYDFDKGVVIDLNPNAQGIEDIKNGPVIRPVGNPFDRFSEDKLRVLRLMRFFSRFNTGDIRQFLDPQTLKAIEHFKNLQAHGITPERIMTEFTGGIKQSLETSSFLANYAALDLYPAVFPGMRVNTQHIQRIGNSKNVKVIYAMLLWGNDNISKRLNALKYPVPINEGVRFLIDLMNFNPASIADITKARERLGKMQPQAIGDADIQELAQIANGLVDVQRIQHLLGYQPPQVSGQELMKQGFQGPAIGQRQRELLNQHYGQSWQDFQKPQPQQPSRPEFPIRFDPRKTQGDTQS